MLVQCPRIDTSLLRVPVKSILILAVLFVGGCATPSPDGAVKGTGVIGDTGGYCDNACVRGLVCSNHTCVKPY